MRVNRNPQNGRVATPCQQCGALMWCWPSASTRKFCDRVCQRRWSASPDRFWEKVDIGEPDGCWPWTAGSDQDGYGRFYLAPRDQNVGAHRYAFFLAHGRWPSAHCLHACDTPACCNPAHLSEGTNAENMAQRRRVGHYALGEAVHTAKVTTADVRTIRHEWTAGASGPSLARRFGISADMVYRIVTRKSWKHVP